MALTFQRPSGCEPLPSPVKAGANDSSPMASPSWATSPGEPSSPAGATQCAAVATTLPLGLSTTLAVHQCSPFAMSTPTVGKGIASGLSALAESKTATATTAASPAAATDAPFTTGRLIARRRRERGSWWASWRASFQEPPTGWSPGSPTRSGRGSGAAVLC